jgi:hypothetical protein
MRDTHQTAAGATARILARTLARREHGIAVGTPLKALLLALLATTALIITSSPLAVRVFGIGR